MPTTGGPEMPVATLAGLPRRSALIYVALFALAFVGYSLLWHDGPYRSGDSQSYMKAAQWASGLRADHLQDRVPGFPLLLALTGSARTPSHLFFYVSLLIHFAGIWMLGVALYAAGIAERPLRAMAVLLLVPPAMEAAAYVLSENLCQAVLTIAFACLVLGHVRKRWVWLIPAALLFGASALVRPVYMALGVCLACSMLLLPWLVPSTGLRLREVVRSAVAIGLVSIVIVGSYSALNRARYGYFGLTPLLGFNLCTRTVSILERLPARYGPVRDELIRYRDANLVQANSTHTGYMYIWTVPRAELAQLAGVDQTHLAGYLLRMNLELIARSPQTYVAEVLRAMTFYGLPAWYPLRGMSSGPSRGFWSLMHFALVAAFVVQLVVLVGTAAFMRARRRVTQRSRGGLCGRSAIDIQVFAYTMAGVVVAYTMAFSCLVEMGNARYRVPTDSLGVAMVFLGASIWSRLLKAENDIQPDEALTPNET